MFALPWDEDDRTVAEWAEEEHQTFIQFVAPLVAKTLDWSEIADEPLETMSTTDSVQWTAGIASPTKPASAAPTASIVKRRGLPYAPGFIPHQPIRNRFATIAKYSKLPRKIGAVPLKSAMMFQGQYYARSLAWAKGTVTMDPVKTVASTVSAKEYDRSYDLPGYFGSAAQRRQQEQNKIRYSPLRCRY